MAIPSNWNTVFKNKELSGNVVIPDKIKPIYKNGVSDWIGPQPDDTTPILYVSSVAGGKDWSEKKFNRRTGINHKCYSYAYCGESSPMRHPKHIAFLDRAIRQGQRIFMDSGAHSFHRMLRSGMTLARTAKVKKEDRHKFVEYLTSEFVSRYAEFIRWSYTIGYKYDFWVTLDAEKNCEVIYRITKQLQKLIGVAPVSVYHGDQSLDWIKRYIDEGHKLIGLGLDSRRVKGKEAKHRYFSEIHEITQKHGVATHAFAITGDRMLRYPFYSVDSSTHIKAASYGKILQVIPEKQRIAQIHVSERYSDFTAYGNICAMDKSAKRVLRDMVEKDGFDLDILVKDMNERITYNAFVLRKAVELNTRQKNKFKTWGALV